MEVLKQSRGPLRRAFTVVANALEEALRDPAPDSDNLAAVISQLDGKSDRLFKLDREISELMFSKGCSDEDYAKEFNATEAYVDRFTVCKAKASRLLSRLDGERQSTTASENVCSHTEHTTKRKFKLPQIELKKFGGEAREWLGFWAQFKKIHEDPDIDTEDKFQYLIQTTVPKSRAREVVEGFPPSASNYSKAVDCLQSPFGREDVLSLVLYNALHPKEKIRLSVLYDKLESQLRALESLGVTSDKYAAMLLPLVESCLPEDILKAWERNRGQSMSRGVTSEERNATTNNLLADLTAFLRSEVEAEERILLVRSGFGFNLESQKKSANKLKPELEPELPTAAGLFCGNQNTLNPNKPSATCIFCEKVGHESRDCSQSAKLTLEEKKNIVVKKRCCFVCLRQGHNAQKCKSKLKCIVCCKRHCTIICPEIPMQRCTFQKADLENPTKEPKDTTLANQTCSPEVLLQTLIVRLRGKNKTCLVRALIDTGSQKSYISEKAAAEMDYESIGQEKVTHSLFGGVESMQQSHRRHRIFLSNLEDSYRCNFEVLDQPTICGEVPRLKAGPWEKELREREIVLSDINKSNGISCGSEIHVLIGADVAGKLLTGRIHQLNFGPVAVETLLGWTLMGKLPTKHSGTVDGTLLVTSLFIQECNVSELWKLDCLGIMYPAEVKTKDESQQDAIANFTQTINKLADGRYEVALPWIAGHPPLPSNLQMVQKRLGKLDEKASFKWTFAGISRSAE